MRASHPALLGLIGAAVVLGGCDASVGGDTARRSADAGEVVEVDAGGYVEPDPVCPDEPCSMTEQCGCVAGQSCDMDETAFAEGRGECRTALASGTGQSTCDTNNECAIGYTCAGGQCRALCDTLDDSDGGECVVPFTYSAGSATAYVPGIHGCTKQCRVDVAVGGGCPGDPNIGCRYYGASPGRYSDCTAADPTGITDVTCDTSADCARGFTCTNLTGGKVCRQACALLINGSSPGNSCSVGTCHAYAAPGLQIDTVVYGYCGI